MRLDRKLVASVAVGLVALLALACGGDRDIVARSDTEAARVRLDVASKPVSLEFRPVLATFGQALPDGGRSKAEQEAAALRTELGIPNGVTAGQVLERSMSEELSGVADPVVGTNGVAIDVTDSRFYDLYRLELRLSAVLTPAEAVVPQDTVTISGLSGEVYELGPVALNGDAVEDATAEEGPGGWAVNLIFREGPTGIDLFNEAAAKCFAGEPECPAQQEHGSLAVLLDGVVLTAPTINEPTFERDQIVISGSGSFTEAEAKEVAASLRHGQGPVVKFKN